MSFVESDHTKVDVIGDVHGCFEELNLLIVKLGYVLNKDGYYTHPDARHLVFVGDLTDRGPHNLKTLRIVLNHVDQGYATCIQGNHCNKLGRYLCGHDVKLTGGLDKTAAEMDGVPWAERKDLGGRLLNLPLYANFDQRRLRVVHASPPDVTKSPDKQKAQCLYGPTTGKTTPLGYPERVDWAPSYEASHGPFIVYGHVAYSEARVLNKSCGIDTGCYKGNRLSAFRWPEREVVFVESLQGTLIEPCPITTLDLGVLLPKFQTEEKEILRLIEEDPKLNKKSLPNGLTIANASKALYEPELEHQLFAKGIVYTTDPYKLVSLPLVKMYNHTCREISDKTTAQVLKDPELYPYYMVKSDGVMIQTFYHDGELYLSTRSMLEGMEDLITGEHTPYLALARQIIEDKYPQLLQGKSDTQNLTFVFELIHPQAHIVTKYGGEEDLILTAIFDQTVWRYKDLAERSQIADSLSLNHTAQYHPPDRRLEEVLTTILSYLEGRPENPEGVIVEFSKGGYIHHRLKVKTPRYLRSHRLKFSVTYKKTVEMIWDDTKLQSWQGLLQYLKDLSLTEEECEKFYKEYLDNFLEWKQNLLGVMDRCALILKEKDPTLTDRDLYKHLAMRYKGEEFFSILMNMARKANLSWQEASRYYPPYEGFQGFWYEWKSQQS